MASESPSRGGVAGMFRRLVGRATKDKGSPQQQQRRRRHHSGPGASSRPYSVAVHGHGELTTMANVVVANTELQKKLQHVDLPHDLLVQFVKYERDKEEAAAKKKRERLERRRRRVASAAAASAGKQEQAPPPAATQGQASDGESPKQASDAGGHSRDTFLRPSLEGHDASDAPPRDAFADMRARLLEQARRRVVAWVEEDLQDPPATVAKLQVMNLLPSTRDMVPLHSDTGDMGGGGTRSRAASASARFMAAHKSMYLSQQPLPSVTKLVQFLDDLALDAPPTRLQRAVEAAHVAATAALEPPTPPAALNQPAGVGTGVGAVALAAEHAPASPGDAGDGAGTGAGAGARAEGEEGPADTAGTDGDANGSQAEPAGGDGAAAADDGAEDARQEAEPEAVVEAPPAPLEQFTTRLKHANAAAIVELLRAFITALHKLDVGRLYEHNKPKDPEDEWSFEPPRATDTTPPTLCACLCSCVALCRGP